MLCSKYIPAYVCMRDLSSHAFAIDHLKSVLALAVTVKSLSYLDPKEILINGDTKNDINEETDNIQNETFIVNQAFISVSLVYQA